MDELDNIITLNDEDGIESKFEFLDLLDYNGDEYVVLLPVDDDPDEPGEVVILKVEPSDDPDEENYVGVEDDVLNAVFDIFKEKRKDEFNFIDERKRRTNIKHDLSGKCIPCDQSYTEPI